MKDEEARRECISQIGTLGFQAYWLLQRELNWKIEFLSHCQAGKRASFGSERFVAEENNMKLSTEDVKSKFQGVKGKSRKGPERLDDPTLECKDEDKVGRIQRTTGQAKNVLEK